MKFRFLGRNLKLKESLSLYTLKKLKLYLESLGVGFFMFLNRTFTNLPSLGPLKADSHTWFEFLRTSSYKVYERINENHYYNNQLENLVLSQENYIDKRLWPVALLQRFYYWNTTTQASMTQTTIVTNNNAVI